MMRDKYSTAVSRIEELKGLEGRLRAKEVPLMLMKIEATELKLKSSERADQIEQLRLNYEKALKDKEAAVDNLRTNVVSHQS
jgi:fructose-specific phosphotransferase system component IIB